MNMHSKLYSPDGADEQGNMNMTSGTSADEQFVQQAHEEDWRGGTDEDNTAETESKLTNLQLDPKPGGDDQTILGAGGLAGGLSGDGTYTDEYDAAVMGLGD